LGPPEVGGFCEPTYDEHLVAAQIAEESLKPVRHRIMTEVRSDPAMAEMIRKSEQAETQRVKKAPACRELRILDLGIPVDDSDSHIGRWNSVRDDLVQRVVDEIQRSTCGPGAVIHLTVPAFRLGDPSIYVLSKLLPSGEEEIEWFRFSRDARFGKYTVYRVKSIGLAEEIEFWRPRIEKRTARQIEIRCPDK